MVFLFILISIIIILIFSSISIEIKNLYFDSTNKTHFNNDYILILKLKIFSLVPIFKIDITKSKLEKLHLKEKIEKIDLDILRDENRFDKKILKAIKKVNIEIENINLKIELGTENAGLTAIIIPIISTVIAILLRRKMKDLDKQIFIVNAIYKNQNMVNIYISGIFEVKIIHIINMIYTLNKKGVKKNERTSNRRAYDYSYE